MPIALFRSYDMAWPFSNCTLVLLLIAVALTALSRRLQIPYPSLLALAGAGLAFVPGAPTIEIDPELALALFVAPVLLDAAFDASLRDLQRQLAAAGRRWSLVAVVLTTAAVALVGAAAVPGMPCAAAIALGAIVAPPDAAAATAVLRSSARRTASWSSSRARACSTTPARC